MDLSAHEDLFFFWDHLNLGRKTLWISAKTLFFYFFGDHLNLGRKMSQSDLGLMKIWVKFVHCCFKLKKSPPLCEILATRLCESNIQLLKIMIQFHYSIQALKISIQLLKMLMKSQQLLKMKNSLIIEHNSRKNCRLLFNYRCAICNHLFF